MQPTSEKLEAYKAAQELLSRDVGNKQLRYVALELRRCLEAVVYEKLLAYGKWIPAVAARTWQPPQAFKALLQVEPDADENATIGVALESEPGVPCLETFKQLGVDRRPRSAWLNKTYNKLGSLLHARWPFARAETSSDFNISLEFCKQVMAELELFMPTFTFSLAEVIEFNCAACGALAAASERSLKRTGAVTCLACDAQSMAKKEGENFIFYLNEPTIVCDRCQNDIVLPARKLQVGYQFSCGTCKCNFEIARKVWEFRNITIP